MTEQSIDYVVKEIDTAKAGVVTIAANDAWDKLAFTAGETVLINANGQRQFFIACPRKGATGGDLYVKTNSFNPKNLTGNVTITRSSACAERRHFLFKTTDGYLLWGGLVVAAGAAVAQAVTALQSTPGPCWVIGSAAFQIIGLAAAFWGAVRNRKP